MMVYLAIFVLLFKLEYPLGIKILPTILNDDSQKLNLFFVNHCLFF